MLRGIALYKRVIIITHMHACVACVLVQLGDGGGGGERKAREAELGGDRSRAVPVANKASPQNLMLLSFYWKN